MDFFEAQARAKRSSGRLIVLFAFAVLGTIGAAYMAALWITRLAGAERSGLWHPDLLGGISLFTALVVGTAALVRWSRLRAGGPAVAEQVGGRLVRPDTTDLHERTLLNVVEEMALASGLPVPAVYVLPDEPAINAFAAGYSQADAAVAVTDGALRRLDREELQGVIAHEFSHILNGDMRLNTRLSALLFGILALSILGRVVLQSFGRAALHGAPRRRSGQGGGGIVVVALAAGFALLVIGFIGHFFGKLIQAAVSRQREFLADAAAVQFTRNPGGLAGALKKLGGAVHTGRLHNARASEISHFCFAQNFRSSLGGVFATHPPLDQRIRAIEPSFDGKYIASTVPARDVAARSTPHYGQPLVSPLASTPTSRSARLIDPAALIESSGQLAPSAVAASRALLDGLPASVRAAAHAPGQVSALCYAICLPHPATGATLAPLLHLVAQRTNAATARQTAELHTDLEALPSDQRLPLLQLATPVLRHLDPAACATLLDTLDALVHADDTVTAHEFALLKILTRTLGLNARPRDVLQFLAPNQVTPDLSIALSAAARHDHAEPALATRAFARAAMGFNGLQPPVVFLSADLTTLGHLDVALDRLALTPAPFRKRILAGIATALAADGRLTLGEAELLRATAAALDCPLPPVLPVSA